MTEASSSDKGLVGCDMNKYLSIILFSLLFSFLFQKKVSCTVGARFCSSVGGLIIEEFLNPYPTHS